MNFTKIIDIVLVFLAIVVLNPLISANAGVQTYSSLILILIWFFITQLHENKLNKTLFQALISFIVSLIVITAIFWNSEGRGYLLIYYFGIFFNILKTFILGYLIARIFSYLLKKMPNLNIYSKKILIAIGIISFLVISLGILFKNINKGSSVSEVQKKYEFSKRIARLIKNNELKDYSNQELIQLNLTNGLYEVKNNKIQNGYNGEVSISKDGDLVKLTYTNIPAKEPCFDFYYINSLKVFGFRQINVNGVEIKYNETSTAEIERVKKKACYASNNDVVVEFIGDIKNIKSLSDHRLR